LAVADLSGQDGLLVQTHAPVYLALGDSFPFGSCDPTLICAVGTGATEVILAKNDNWWVGYPKYLQEIIDRPLVNAGCGGETTTSFLTNSGGAACRRAENAGVLHVNYDYTQLTQMAFAAGYLATHRVELVTLHLGGPETNQLIRTTCGYDPYNPTPAAVACVQERLPAQQAGLMARLEIILATIRGTGYSGRIIVPSYGWYTFNDYVAQIAPGLYEAWVPLLDDYDAELLQVFEAFQAASQPYGGDPCAAGVQVTLANGACDIHPTIAGHQLIASLIAEMLLSGN
jgi:hypothetical protein